MPLESLSHKVFLLAMSFVMSSEDARSVSANMIDALEEDPAAMKMLEALEKFLECDDKFSWWVLGGIGGGGKSRLALEFCNKCIDVTKQERYP